MIWDADRGPATRPLPPSAEVLIVDTFRLGDHVYLASFVDSLKQRRPDLEISVLASHVVSESKLISRDVAGVYNVHVPWLTPGWVRRPLKLAGLFVELRACLKGRTFDFTLIPRGALLECLFVTSRVFGRKVAFKKCTRSGLAPHLLGFQNDHIYTCRSRFLSELVGDPHAEVNWPFLTPRWSPGAGRTVLCAPEASNEGKCWPTHNWTDLARRLTANGFNPVLVLGPKSKFVCELGRSFSAVAMAPVPELRNLIASAMVVVGCDSFVGHLAAAQGAPVISLFGPTDPRLWRPWGANVTVIRKPQQTEVRFTRKSILSAGPQLMAEITVDRVYEEVIAMMGVGRGTLTPHVERRGR